MTQRLNSYDVEPFDKLISCCEDPEARDVEEAKEIIEFLEEYRSSLPSNSGVQGSEGRDDEYGCVKQTLSSVIEILYYNLPVWDEWEYVKEDDGNQEDEGDSSDSEYKNGTDTEASLDLGEESRESKDTSHAAASRSDADERVDLESNCDELIEKLELLNIQTSTKERVEPAPEVKSGEEELWNSFVENLHRGSVVRSSNNGFDDEEEEPDSDFFCNYESSSDDCESSDESIHGEGGLCTLPYMDSGNESEDDALAPVRGQNAHPILFNRTLLEEDVIIIDDDDDEEEKHIHVGGPLICNRCPAEQRTFKDKEVFSIHRKRHVGLAHYVCPICSKPFIKLSFCMAHEIRTHGVSFNSQHAHVVAASKYVKEKVERNAKTRHQSTSSQTFNQDETDNGLTRDLDGLARNFTHEENIAEFGSEDGIEDECETDEDDAKFYPNHAVPSTALYPYRGPVVDSIYECYEIHLRYGRKKRTATSVSARVILAHRQQLKEQERIPVDSGGRFFKIKQGPDNGRATENIADRGRLYSLADRLHSQSRAQPGPSPVRVTKKKCKKSNAKNKKESLSNRTFVSNLIRRICLLCQYIWKSEEDLRKHRDEKHPGKKVIDLMTVPKKSKKSAYRSDSDSEEDLFVPVPSRRNRQKEQAGPRVIQISKEEFLSKLGLISVKKLTLRKRKARHPPTKPCQIELARLPQAKLPRSGRVFLCNICSYYDRSRDLIEKHKQSKHHADPPRKSVKRKRGSKSGSDVSNISHHPLAGTSRKASASPSSLDNDLRELAGIARFKAQCRRRIYTSSSSSGS